MSSSSNIRGRVGKGRSQILDAYTLKATKALRQRGMSTPNQSHDSSFGNGITYRREKIREVLCSNSIMLPRGHDDKVKVATELRVSLHVDVSK